MYQTWRAHIYLQELGVFSMMFLLLVIFSKIRVNRQNIVIVLVRLLYLIINYLPLCYILLVPLRGEWLG